ncbi:MAG: hypothetical protein ACKO2S_03295 [Burkholderiaceae bacterium]
MFKQKNIQLKSRRYQLKRRHHLPRVLAVVLTSVWSLILAACVPTTPQWDAQFGQSVRLAQQRQTLDPTAGGDDPVNGIDGSSGREAIVRYRSSFKEPAPVNSSFTIGVTR